MVKTRRDIREALIQLLLAKSFHEITVQNILDEALINRKTFYSHYADKYALADELCEECLMKLEKTSSVRVQFSESHLANFMSSIDDIYTELYEERRMFLALWDIKTERVDMQARIRELLMRTYSEMEKRTTTTNDTELQSFLMCSIILSMFRFVLEAEKRYTPGEIIAELEGLFTILLSK